MLLTMSPDTEAKTLLFENILNILYSGNIILVRDIRE